MGAPYRDLTKERGHYSDRSGLARGVSRRIGRSAQVRLRAEVPDPHTNSQNITSSPDDCFLVKNTRSCSRDEHDTRANPPLPEARHFHGDAHFGPAGDPWADFVTRNTPRQGRHGQQRVAPWHTACLCSRAKLRGHPAKPSSLRRRRIHVNNEAFVAHDGVSHGST